MYNDNYETCSETYVTFRIYYENMNSEQLTQYLEIEPTRTQNKGDIKVNSVDSKYKSNGWFLTSKTSIKSKDCRRHIDFLLDKLLPVKKELKKISEDGGKLDFSCYWKSKDGHGGPTLSHEQFSRLAELHFDLWFDVY